MSRAAGGQPACYPFPRCRTHRSVASAPLARPAGATTIMHRADTNAYVVAVDRRRVGVAVAAGSGFRFIAADPAFRPLDGSSFRRLAQLEQAAAQLART